MHFRFYELFVFMDTYIHDVPYPLISMLNIIIICQKEKGHIHVHVRLYAYTYIGVKQ